MRPLHVLPVVLVLGLCQTGFAQTRTEETRTTVDPAKGDTVKTESVIISRSLQAIGYSQQVLTPEISIFPSFVSFFRMRNLITRVLKVVTANTVQRKNLQY